MLRYFGILYPNNCGSLKNSKIFFLNNPFLLSLLHQLLSVLMAPWPSKQFSLCRSFSPRSSTPVSLNKRPTIIPAWQALYRRYKPPHSSSLRMLSEAIIIIIIINLYSVDVSYIMALFGTILAEKVHWIYLSWNSLLTRKSQQHSFSNSQ